MSDKNMSAGAGGGSKNVFQLHSSGYGGYGSGGGGMDLAARIDRLEEDMKEVKGDMKALRSDVSELKGKVSMLPGYTGITAIVGTIVALSTAAQIFSKYLP